MGSRQGTKDLNNASLDLLSAEQDHYREQEINPDKLRNGNMDLQDGQDMRRPRAPIRNEELGIRNWGSARGRRLFL